jgi:hypothetical protein
VHFFVPLRIWFSQRVWFWLLTVVNVAPVWLVPWFVTQDGPSHLENANILRLYHSVPTYQRYFRVNLAPVPNWFSHASEAALLSVVEPRLAEKLFLTGYVLGFVLGVRAAVRALQPDAEWQSVLAFPLIFNCLLLYGFLNFCWSLCFFLLFVAAALARPRRWWMLVAIGFVLYFSHVVSWFMAAAVAGVLAVCRRQWRPLAALAPSSMLAVWFVGTGAVMTGGGAAVGFGQRWSALWRASTAVFSYGDAALSASCGVLILGLAAVSAARRNWNLWSAAAALSAALYFASPPQAGAGQYVLERLNLYVLLALALWVAAAARSKWEVTFLFAAASILSIAMVCNVVVLERRINDELGEYLSVAGSVPRESSLLPVQYDSRGPGELQKLYGFPMRHAASYIAVERRALNLDNYEAQTPLFPLIFREELNPGVRIGHIEDEPPAPKLIPELVESVLVWNPLGARVDGSLEERLGAAYSLVAVSPRGFAKLYRARPAEAGRP